MWFDWAECIFVVDSGSTDKTIDIASSFTDQVIYHPFTNQAEQFNWALDNLPIETEWVFRLDADEFLTPDLIEEIRTVLPRTPGNVTGLIMKRRVYFKGRWIKHGGYYPIWLLRLFRYGKAQSEQLEMDEHIVLLEGETQRLKNDFVDNNHKDLTFWTLKHENYAAREARSLLKLVGDENKGDLGGEQSMRKRWLKGNVYARSPLFLRALLYFLFRYFVLLGFLDGVEGLIFHTLQGFWYRFYVDAKIWEIQHQTEREKHA